MDNDKCTWLTLLPAVFVGAEGDDNDSNDESGDDADEGDDSDQDDADDSSGNEHDDANDPKVMGLKASLAAERKANKDKDKELKALRKAADAKDLSEKDEIEQLRTKDERNSEKLTRLSSGLLNTRLEQAIRAAASDFIDTDDALAGVDRSKLVYEQDEDDPSDITIDLKSVAKAVKELATKKPHFLSKGTEDGEPTGNRFGGGRQKKPDTTNDEYLAAYPSLRNN